MKKIIFAAIAAMTLAGCTSGSVAPTVIQGKFIGYSNEYVEFFEIDGPGSFKEIPLTVNPDGTFCDTVQFDATRFDEALFADKFMFRVYLEPGKTYEAEFDLTNPGVETNFRFIGEGAAENAFMSHLWAAGVYDKLESIKGYEDCRAMLDETYEPLLAELKTIDNKPFVKYYEKDIADSRKMYACYSPFYAIVANGVAVEDPEFDAFIAKNFKKLSDADFEKTMNNVFMNVAYSIAGIDGTEALKAAAFCAAKDSQKELAMNLMLTDLAAAGNLNGIAEAYEYFQDCVLNDDYLDNADSLCRKSLALAAGTKAPEIEFRDAAGKVYGLSNFTGKPLYIDLWASWCGPCCEEIPFLKKFAESLGKNPEIQCISISIDDEEADWKAKLAEVSPTWPQFIATAAGQQSISGQYFVSGIPRFMLLDAEGNIASVNAPRPSDPDLLAKLRDLLCAE